MEKLSDFLTNASPEQRSKYRSFLEAHPNAYLQEVCGMRSGIIRYREWRVVDPDDNYRTLGTGKEAVDALYEARLFWIQEFARYQA